jgi:hypothetical protein
MGSGGSEGKQATLAQQVVNRKGFEQKIGKQIFLACKLMLITV